MIEINLSFGLGWAATSPLAYTLQRLNKYAHGGHTKEMKYLFFRYKSGLHDRIKNLVLNDLWMNSNGGSHPMNSEEDISIIKDYPKDIFEDYLTPPFTIEKYINYYKTLWELVKSEYKSVADYTKYEPFDDPSIAHALLTNFNVKCMMIVRDPVRLAWSRSLAISEGQSKEISIWFDDYVDLYDRIKFYFPQTHMIVMEELWEGDGSEKDKLSSFLDHPVNQLWTNLYSPDRGHLVENDPRVPCQSAGQKNKELTPEIYNDLKKQHQWVYDKWVDRFGSLPLHWGEPIDYEQNALIYNETF